jgi:hypothetical protein
MLTALQRIRVSIPFRLANFTLRHLNIIIIYKIFLAEELEMKENKLKNKQR